MPRALKARILTDIIATHDERTSQLHTGDESGKTAASIRQCLPGRICEAQRRSRSTAATPKEQVMMAIAVAHHAARSSSGTYTSWQLLMYLEDAAATLHLDCEMRERLLRP